MIINHLRKSERGTTITELAVVIGIFTILIGFVTVNLLTVKNRASLSSSLTALITDIKGQQTKTMSSATEGGPQAYNYGIYFGEDSYTLFRGSSYNQADPLNVSVDLGDNIEFSDILLPSPIIVFLRQSGEVLGFDSNLNTVIIRNIQTDEQKTIKINRYGVVIQVN